MSSKILVDDLKIIRFGKLLKIGEGDSIFQSRETICGGDLTDKQKHFSCIHFINFNTFNLYKSGILF